MVCSPSEQQNKGVSLSAVLVQCRGLVVYYAWNKQNKVNCAYVGPILPALNDEWGLGQRSGQGTTLQVGRTRDQFQELTLGICSVAADISLCPGDQLSL